MASDKSPAPSRRTGGRVTPKGGPTPKKASTNRSGGSRTPEASTRYTPPIPRDQKVSPRWVPVLMLVLVALGVLIIFLHYVDLVLPGASSNWWLLAGLVAILGGIVTATQYR
jgi:hypothetical protein